MDETEQRAAELAAVGEAEAPAYEDETDAAVASGRWTVSTLDDANFALERLAQLEAEVEANEQLASQAIQRIEARTRRLNERANRGVEFFRSQLDLYARTHRAELLGKGRKKSRDLPCGRIQYRSRAAGLVVEDKAALLKWARTQAPELRLVRVREEPALDAIKKACAPRSGSPQVVPPGMRWEDESEDVVVTAAGDALALTTEE